MIVWVINSKHLERITCPRHVVATETGLLMQERRKLLRRSRLSTKTTNDCVHACVLRNKKHLSPTLSFAKKAIIGVCTSFLNVSEFVARRFLYYNTVLLYSLQEVSKLYKRKVLHTERDWNSCRVHSGNFRFSLKGHSKHETNIGHLLRRENKVFLKAQL